MYLRLKRFCASSEDNRMRPSPVSKVMRDTNSSVGVAEAEKRLGREDSGPVMSLDLTGEPFPRMGSDDSDREVVEYRRCRDGHIDIWYDSTDSDKCPLCAVRERSECAR